MTRVRITRARAAALVVLFSSAADAVRASQLTDDSSNAAPGLVAFLILLVVAFVLYFLPSFIGKHKQNFGAIFVLNLLLGWTLIGWVVAMVWAVTKETAPTQVIVNPAAASVFCSSCGKYSQAGSRFCGACGAPIA